MHGSLNVVKKVEKYYYFFHSQLMKQFYARNEKKMKNRKENDKIN